MASKRSGAATFVFYLLAMIGVFAIAAGVVLAFGHGRDFVGDVVEPYVNDSFWRGLLLALVMYAIMYGPVLLALKSRNGKALTLTAGWAVVLTYMLVLPHGKGDGVPYDIYLAQTEGAGWYALGLLLLTVSLMFWRAVRGEEADHERALRLAKEQGDPAGQARDVRQPKRKK